MKQIKILKYLMNISKSNILKKKIHKANKLGNEKIVNYVNDALI